MTADRATLRERVVLVTGAASGIGAAGVLELAQRGALPVIMDVDDAQARAVARAASPDTLALPGDVCSPDDCRRVVEAILRHHGRLDAVWANAGIASLGPLAHTDPQAWRRCFDINVLGVFNVFRASLPAVVAHRGRLLVSASVASFAHPPMMSAYAASKAAVEAMANAWRIELAAHAVSVGVVHASWVRTPMVEEGESHPVFLRLRAAAPSWMNAQMEAGEAARRIVDGLQRRDDRIWVPGWVRLLHWLRPMLHARFAEAALRRAAPELEAGFLESLREHGPLASSLGPRERERASERRASGT